MFNTDKLFFYYVNSNFSLHDISFSLPRGQIVGLLGGNGAGKTTLIRCIVGLYPLHGGSVKLDGDSGEGIRAKLSYVSGEGAVFGGYSPKEVGEFLAEHYPAFDMKRYLKLIDYFELPQRSVRSMSKGQRTKAELAAGLCKGADYIFMDEPFANKDVFTRKDFLKIMAGSLKENETIVLSTHLVEEVENFIDRALIMHKGKLTADVEMDDLRSRGESLMVLLSEHTGYDETSVASLFA